jgi:anti-sigma B factor antagonist
MREPVGELGEVQFRIEEQPAPGTIVLSIRGEADLHSAPDLRDQIAALIEEGVDLAETTFIDSMTLGVLLGAMKRIRARGGHLRLVVPATDVRRIFEITLLDRVFPLHETREEAVRAAAAAGER